MHLHLDFFSWIIHYKYLVIFPITVFEGPIISVIVGFLLSLHYLNFWIVFPILIMADLVGDSMYYAIGRFGREKFILKYGHYVGINLEKIERWERFFHDNRNKAMIVGKFAHGTGFLMWIVTGIIKMRYWKFLEINFYTTLVKTSILMVVGYYFGQAYGTINGYFNYLALFFALLLLSLYFVVTRTTLLNKFFHIEEPKDSNS